MARHVKSSRDRSFWGALFITPSFAILLLILIIPIGMSLFYSFTDYSVLSSPEWVGARNYVDLLSDGSFISALRHTLVYTVLSVPLQTVIALVVAELLAKRFRNRFGGAVRSALFVPVISSLVVVAVVWRSLVGIDGGLINSFIAVFGLGPINFLGNPQLALVTVAMVSVWKNIGYFLVIYYAGIMEIPRELYEASEIDGASRFQQMLHITIPSLRPVTQLVVILGTIWSFQVFDSVYVMTGGGPGGATTTIVMAIYRTGFQNFKMGYASAMAIVLFVMVLAIAIVQRKVIARNEP